MTDLEDICSIFHQVRPVVSHIEFCLPKKALTPKNIGEALKVLRGNSVKKIYLCDMIRTKMSDFFWIPSQ